MEQKGNSERSKGKRILFIILTWVAVLILMEAGIRMARPEVGRAVYSGYPKGLVVQDDDLGHGYKPEFKGYFAQPRYKDIPISINSFGFRDEEWAAKPAPGVTRVMVMGDSITFGSPLRVEDRFTEIAQKSLTEKGVTTEFMNCGVNGYNVEQYDRLVRKEGQNLKPTLVLVGLCLNDADPTDPEDARRIRIGDGIKQGKTSAKISKFAMDHRMELDRYYFFRLARRAIKLWMWRSEEYAEKMNEKYNQQTRKALVDLYEKGDGISRLSEHFSSMKEFSDNTLSAKLGVVIFAYHHQVSAADPNLSRMIGKTLNALSIPYVDLYDVFLPHAQESGFYAYRDDCHPAEPGHKAAGLAAAGLVESMLSQN